MMKTKKFNMALRKKRNLIREVTKNAVIQELRRIESGTEVEAQKVRELLASFPSIVRALFCKKALSKATSLGQEEIIHVLNEAGVIIVQQEIKKNIAKYIEMQEEEVVKLNPEIIQAEVDKNGCEAGAFCLLTLASGLHHNKLNEDLRNAATTKAVIAVLASGAKPNYYGCYGSTSLHEAAYCRRSECLSVLIQHGGNIAARTSEGRTPLHAAAISGDKASIAVLLKAGADVNAKDYCSLTALHYAAGSIRSEDCVPLLIKTGSSVNHADSFGMTPLHYAAAYGTATVVKYLLDSGARTDIVDLWNRTPQKMVINKVNMASKETSRAVIKSLLNPEGEAEQEEIEEGKREYKWFENEDSCNPDRDRSRWFALISLRKLSFPSKKYSKNKLAELLRQDTGLIKTYSCCKALQACVESGRNDLVEVFLSCGANPDAREGDDWLDEDYFPNADIVWIKNDYENWPLLHIAALAGHEKVVDVLVQKGASLKRISVFDRDEPFGPLEAAALGTQLVVLRTLLVAGCLSDRDQLDAALSLAFKPCQWEDDCQGCDATHHMKIARMLMDAGADPCYQDHFGQTPAHEAAAAGWLHCLSLLVQRGGDIEAENKNGSTPLHLAARGGHDTCVAFLIEEGADVCVRDNVGQTPLHYAAQGRVDGKWAYIPWLRAGDMETIKALLIAGAEVNDTDNNGVTPLHLAAGSVACHFIVEMLLKLDACVNAKDRENRTPLHYAAAAGLINMVQTLLDAGADPDAKDIIGRSPRDDARKGTIQLLRPGSQKEGVEEGEVEDGEEIKYDELDIDEGIDLNNLGEQGDELSSDDEAEDGEESEQEGKVDKKVKEEKREVDEEEEKEEEKDKKHYSKQEQKYQNIRSGNNGQNGRNIVTSNAQHFTDKQSEIIPQNEVIKEQNLLWGGQQRNCRMMQDRLWKGNDYREQQGHNSSNELTIRQVQKPYNGKPIAFNMQNESSWSKRGWNEMQGKQGLEEKHNVCNHETKTIQKGRNTDCHSKQQVYKKKQEENRWGQCHQEVDMTSQHYRGRLQNDLNDKYGRPDTSVKGNQNNSNLPTNTDWKKRENRQNENEQNKLQNRSNIMIDSERRVVRLEEGNSLRLNVRPGKVSVGSNRREQDMWHTETNERKQQQQQQQQWQLQGQQQMVPKRDVYNRFHGHESVGNVQEEFHDLNRHYRGTEYNSQAGNCSREQIYVQRVPCNDQDRSVVQQVASSRYRHDQQGNDRSNQSLGSSRQERHIAPPVQEVSKRFVVERFYKQSQDGRENERNHQSNEQRFVRSDPSNSKEANCKYSDRGDASRRRFNEVVEMRRDRERDYQRRRESVREENRMDFPQSQGERRFQGEVRTEKNMKVQGGDRELPRREAWENSPYSDGNKTRKRKLEDKQDDWHRSEHWESNRDQRLDRPTHFPRELSRSYKRYHR